MKNQNTTSKIGNKPEETTKEKIFNVSLDLFSQKGFNGVSVREIAREVGIRESSIYNHYKNKEAILDAIMEYFISELQGGPPDEEMDKLMETPELFFEVGARDFIERMNTPNTQKIWRLISIELFHNEKIREFSKKKLFDAPIKGWEEIFTKMIEEKVIKPVNPKILAYEYFSFTLYLYFEYFILNYNESNQTFMEVAWDKMSDHTEFILNSIKIN